MSMRIDVAGVGLVEVDPSFSDLSPEEQEEFIGEIQSSVRSGRTSSNNTAVTGNNIAPSASTYDLSNFNPPQAQPTQAQPPQQAEPVDETFGGLLPDQKNILKGFWLFNRDYDNLVDATAKTKQDQLKMADEKQIIVANEWEGPLQQAGFNRADVEFKMDALRKIQDDDPSLSLDQALERVSGSKTPQQDILPKIDKLTQLRDADLRAADGAQDPAEQQRFAESAANYDQQIRKLRQLGGESWNQRLNEVRVAKQRLTNIEKKGGGTLDFRGRLISDPAAAKEAVDRAMTDLELEAADNPSVLPINLGNVRFVEEDPATGARRANLGKLSEFERSLAESGKLRSGDYIQNPITGQIETWEKLGHFDAVEAGSPNKLIPKRLQPAVRGVGVVAGKVADAASQYLTEDNLAAAANFVVPGMVGSGAVRTVAAAARNPQEAVARLARGATMTMPGGLLALKGLDYLSEIGRRAEEEEKKKLAGQ